MFLIFTAEGWCGILFVTEEIRSRIMREQEQKEALLAQLSFSEYLTEEQKKELLAVGKLESFQEGQLIYTPIRECLGMIYVVKGVIRTSLTSESGKKATMFRLREKEVCVLSMSCILSAITFDVEVEADKDCELFVIPAPVFSRISQENMYVENFSYKVVTERFSAIVEAMQQMMFMSLEQRVIVFLLDESAAVGQDLLLITQEQLAENIGSAREAVTRVLKQLKEKELIVLGRGKIEILKRKELYQFI